MYPGDFDGDGFIDVTIGGDGFLGCGTGCVQVLWGDGTGAFLVDETLTLSERLGDGFAVVEPMQTYGQNNAIDFDGDGLHDLYLPAKTNLVSIALSTGDGAFALSSFVELASGAGPRHGREHGVTRAGLPAARGCRRPVPGGRVAWLGG